MSELGLIEYPKTNSREISSDRSMPSLNHSFLCLKLIQALLKNDSIFVTTETEERRFHREIVRCGDIEVDFNKVFVESDT